MKTEYIVITPVRNEEAYIRKTINSMIAQTIKPQAWVLVNDGSTDNTRKIIEEYLSRYPWIKLVTLLDRGKRKLGSGVVDAFYEGLQQIKNHVRYDFLVKLDGDLAFDKHYFSSLLKKFSENKKLGIASGQTYIPLKGKLVWERTNDSHVRGPSKMYRKKCFQEIGGLVSKLGWDTIDEVRAQMKGWETRSFRAIQLIHLRPTGSSTGHWLVGKMREGKIAYFLGYSFLFTVARGLRQLFERPYLTGGLALILGYAESMFSMRRQFEDKAFIAFLRKQQKKRLFPLL